MANENENTGSGAMSERIGPGHTLFTQLHAARASQGGEVVEYQGVYYFHFLDNDSDYYVLIERKNERDSLGKISTVHQGWYPPKVQEPK